MGILAQRCFADDRCLLPRSRPSARARPPRPPACPPSSAPQRNNYSSGRNEDRLLSPNGGNIEQAWAPDDMPGPHKKDALPIHGSEGTFNMNSMLLENIRSSDYFRSLSIVRQWDELVDQIYYDVKPEYGCEAQQRRRQQQRASA